MKFETVLKSWNTVLILILVGVVLVAGVFGTFYMGLFG